MTEHVTRRDAVKGAAALFMGFHLPAHASNRVDQEKRAQSFAANAWVRIARDNSVTLLTEIPEMGQGTRTANVMMLADELEVEWSSIRWEQAPVVPKIYKSLATGGSGGTAGSWLSLRRAGAEARELLLTAAAQQWGAPKQECRAEQGAIIHVPSGRSARYGTLIDVAAALPSPDWDKVPLKDPKQFRFIGKPLGRVDTPEKVMGTAIFGLDVRVPGMLFAVLARNPHLGGRALHFDDSDAKASPGVKAVFAVPSIGYNPELGHNLNVAGGVAVVASSTWAAMQGRKTLNIQWDQGRAPEESTATLQDEFRAKAKGLPTVTSVDRGKPDEALAAAAHKIEADYEIPFQAHATMEPMNTTVHVREDGTIEVWTPTQIGEIAQTTIAKLAGIPPEKVVVHMLLSGGSFGRRYQWDYLAEAYQVASQMRVPVQLVWTREDDMQHDFYLQYSFQRMSGALDPAGNILAWTHRIVSTPIRAVFASPESLTDPKKVASADETGDIHYQTPNYRSDYAPVLSVVPRAWWRGVSAPFQVFAVECFVDELAHAASQDPLEFRLRHLRSDQTGETARLQSVLKLAADKAGWGTKLPPHHGRGIACCLFADTCIAHVAEISAENGKLRVLRVTSAVDCGLAVNPDSVRAQIEGGINYALTPVLHGEISVKQGAIQQSNFHQYQVLRLNEAPEISVHLVPSSNPKPLGGVGEGGVPPLAPAVANAVFAATGKRVRRLPILKIT